MQTPWMVDRMGRDTVSWLRVSGQLGGISALTTSAMKYLISTYYGHIRVLLSKTNPMIYICHIKYLENVPTMSSTWETMRTARVWESCGWVWKLWFLSVHSK